MKKFTCFAATAALTLAIAFTAQIAQAHDSAKAPDGTTESTVTVAKDIAGIAFVIEEAAKKTAIKTAAAKEEAQPSTLKPDRAVQTTASGTQEAQIAGVRIAKEVNGVPYDHGGLVAAQINGVQFATNTNYRHPMIA